MFDIGFTELLVVGVVALIVVGPKDLPGMFRTLGRITARMRALGREFTSAMNAAADESGMKDVAKDLKGMTSPKAYGLDKLNEAADRFDNWTPGASKSGTAPKRGEIDEDRAADIERIRAATEAQGRANRAADKAEAADDAPARKPVKGKPPEHPKPRAKSGDGPATGAKPASETRAKAAGSTAKTAAKTATAKTAPAKKAPAKKTAAAKTPAAEKTAAKKPGAGKTTARKAPAKKPAAKTSPAKTKTDDA